jgi:hypothetical protein
VNPWLTAADVAEIDCVARTLAYGIFEHREHCPACRESRYGCSAVSAAIQHAVDWAEIRAMTSKAEALRAEQNGRRAA